MLLAIKYDPLSLLLNTFQKQLKIVNGIKYPTNQNRSIHGSIRTPSIVHTLRRRS